jgi:two-component system, OmpR family, sensor histidine kinase KdpD
MMAQPVDPRAADREVSALLSARTTRHTMGGSRPATGDHPGTATGRLRVYLGMAAGVGKTYAMLSEAHRLAMSGCDVVIGFVTTHGRPETQSLLGDFEVVPPKVVAYHGAQFEELDVDAILARHPDIALVDELAHSNVPGSGRNSKRWQDVLELLAANVSVITTVNVQHVQSLADAAERRTATRVSEHVPDVVLGCADQIELVDCSPEQLRSRMRRGNIYPPGRVQQALNGFFCTENLTALRELTLRFMADNTNGDQPRQLRGYQRPAYETAERVLVGVTGAYGSDVVLQRAARFAARLRADLHVAHTTTTWTRRRADTDNPTELRELAEQLGAHWIEVRSDDPVAALMQLAWERQATQIVLSLSQRNRWQEFFGDGSTLRRLTRLAGKAGIEVHVIVRAGDRTGRNAHDALPPAPRCGECLP